MLPEGLLLNLLDKEFDDEQTFEKGNEQFDLIKTLLVHGPKTLHNHFSKITVATSVNDIITVNVMDMDLLKKIATAQGMVNTVNKTMDTLLGKRPNILEKLDEERTPDGITALTNHDNLWYSKMVKKLHE
jgi:hypothetical protein